MEPQSESTCLRPLRRLIDEKQLPEIVCIHVSIGTDQFDARGCIEDYTQVSRAFIIASPTLCLTPPLMSDVADADSHLRVNRRIVRNTAWVNYLGLCEITMPLGRDRAGMPVGLQLTAPAHAEERLLD